MFWGFIARQAFKKGIRKGYRAAYNVQPRSGYSLRTGQWHRRGRRYYRVNPYGEITGRRNWGSYWGGKAAPYGMTYAAPYAQGQFSKRTRRRNYGTSRYRRRSYRY